MLTNQNFTLKLYLLVSEVFGNEPFWLPCQNLIHFMENNSKPVLSVTELSLLEMVPGVSSSAEISWHILKAVIPAIF